MIHIHFDPVGGIAGDMFIAAMLHTYPNLETPMIAAIRAAGLPDAIKIQSQAFQDFALTGLRFIVEEPESNRHEHRAFADIVGALKSSSLEEKMRDRAIAIFTLLAEVEGQIHGVATHDVSFHELGGWDSIADIAGAAFLIESHRFFDQVIHLGQLGRGEWGYAHLAVFIGVLFIIHDYRRG